MTLRVLPAALADIRAIARHIAIDNPRAAQRWTDSIMDKCARIGEMPGIGVARPDVDSDLSLFPVGTYVIFYRQVGTRTEIIRVLHGARDWRTLL